jgi:hypothetical protein
MRIRKLMYDSFFVNNEAFSGITSVESLSSDLYFHYVKNESGHYKLSGNTATSASGVIFEDSVTTSIVVTPSTFIGYTGDTRQLSVVNQDNVDVITECLFASSNPAISVSTGGLISIVSTGSSTITVTHNDGPTGSTAVTGYWPVTSVVVTPAAFTGTTTGQTQQLTVVDQNGRNIIAYCTFVSFDTSIFTVNTAGLVTCVGNIGDGYITATHTASGNYARPVTTWRFQP